MYAQCLWVVTKSRLCHNQYLSGFQMIRDTLSYVKEKIAYTFVILMITLLNFWAINFHFSPLCQGGWAYVNLTCSSSALLKPSGKLHFMNELFSYHPNFDIISQCESMQFKNILWALYININTTITSCVWRREGFKLNITKTLLCWDWTMCSWNIETTLKFNN